jgi:hypothetical protein
MGTPLPYLSIWTVTVLSINPFPFSDQVTPEGKFMRVNMLAAHSSPKPETLLLPLFVLRDDRGRIASPNISTNQKIFGADWSLTVSPAVAENRDMVFDVAKDAGDSFILESNADPTFRVAMTVEQRG